MGVIGGGAGVQLCQNSFSYLLKKGLLSKKRTGSKKMHSVSLGDDLHEIQRLISGFLIKMRKYFKMSTDKR